MTILTSRAREVAEEAVRGTPGAVARMLERAAKEEARCFVGAVLQETIRLNLQSALGPARQRRKAGRAIPWPCPGCGERRADQVMRNGGYERHPLTQYGPVLLRMPQLVCRGCGRAVPFSLPCLPRWRRLWHDVEHQIVRAYLGGHSYRTVASQVAGSLGLMTTWRSLQRIAEGEHRPAPRPELTAVGLDELHTRIRGKPAWFLVARGKSAASGHYLGTVLSEDKSQKAWELALDNLGLQRLPTGVPLISDGDHAIEAAVTQCLPGRRLDRCAWHLLHNVAGWLRERLPGAEQEGQRRGLMAAAQAVVNAASPQARRSCLRTLREVAPWLARALAHSLERVGYSGQATARTNNVCERAFREWRRRTRPMDGFKSWQGARNFATLWMLKENARAAGQDWMEVIMP